MVGNLKLEVTNYSRELYGLGGVAHPSDGDDDDDVMMMEVMVMRRIRRRLLATNQGRGDAIDYLQ